MSLISCRRFSTPEIIYDSIESKLHNNDSSRTDEFEMCTVVFLNTSHQLILKIYQKKNKVGNKLM